MTDHAPAYRPAAPLAVPMNGNTPVGWLSPSVADEQEREAHRKQIAREQAQAANAAVNAEVDRRMSAGNEVTNG